MSEYVYEPLTRPQAGLYRPRQPQGFGSYYRFARAPNGAFVADGDDSFGVALVVGSAMLGATAGPSLAKGLLRLLSKLFKPTSRPHHNRRRGSRR